MLAPDLARSRVIAAPLAAEAQVSVIMIFLDAERFIAEAIESVLAQDFAGWELLLVDDGSSDAGTRIAKDFARRHPARIRYLDHPGHRNRGMSASRNAGIAASRAPLVAFLDADDVWRPEKLAQQVAIMNSQPAAGMVFGNSLYWSGWTGRAEDAKRDFVRRCGPREDVLVRAPFFLLTTLHAHPHSPPSMSSVLVRRELLEQIGGFEERFTGMCEDMAFQVKAFLQAAVYYSGCCWDSYRQHADSCCAVAERRGERRAAHLSFLRWTRGYLAERAVADPQLLQAVEEALFIDMHPFLARARPGYFYRKLRERFLAQARRRLPPQTRAALRRAQRALRRPWLALVRTLRLRWLWRVRPVHDEFGCYYGTPVDRFYIERFLAGHARDVRGHVLEIGDDTYTRRYGEGRVTSGDVLHAIAGNAAATIVADLTDAPHIASNRFDCIVFTQTLQCIYDFRAALRTLHRILKPGGVLLVTIPGVAHQISREERPYWGDFWRWTTLSAERMFAEVFPAECVQIRAHGNVLTSVAFLHGLVVEELRAKDFEHDDPAYELSICIRAVKPAAP